MRRRRHKNLKRFMGLKCEKWMEHGTQRLIESGFLDFSCRWSTIMPCIGSMGVWPDLKVGHIRFIWPRKLKSVHIIMCHNYRKDKQEIPCTTGAWAQINRYGLNIPYFGL
jgi:hypothetical protein